MILFLDDPTPWLYSSSSAIIYRKKIDKAMVCLRSSKQNQIRQAICWRRETMETLCVAWCNKTLNNKTEEVIREWEEIKKMPMP